MINVPHILGTHFIQFNLSDLLEQLGEESVKSVLSSFSCPLNRDVEFFLKHKSIEMSRRNFSKTYLVFWETDDQLEREFVGYYALAAKTITVDPSVVSNRQKNKLREYGSFDTHINKFIVNATLIGQLGKNYSNGNDTLISGSDLLQMAIDKAKEVQNIIGGRYVYLECEDNKKLLDFYTSNHFVEFGSRTLDGDEIDRINGNYLKQLFAML